MGAGASNANRRTLELYYSGHQSDYTNYKFFHQYFEDRVSNGTIQSSRFQAWIAYQRHNNNLVDEHVNDNVRRDAYVEYRKLAKFTLRQTADRNKLFQLKVTDDSGCSSPEFDNAEVAIENRSCKLSLSTLCAALRLTILKRSSPEETRCGLSNLKVTILDTVGISSIDFIKEKPRVVHKYVDSEFTKEKALGRYRYQYEWKRPEQVFPDVKICLFHEGTSVEDVDQGIFSTCYFLATLAGLANTPEAMKRIILSDAYDGTSGIFHCQFWKFGQWHDVYIDDYLPCIDNELVCCRSNNHKGELWVSLMEKAYAKFMGSYPAIEGGTPREAYIALTGGCADWLPLTYLSYNPPAVYSRITNALMQGAVVVCSTTPKTDEMRHNCESLGLVVDHAYTVTSTAVLERDKNECETLVQLRNPWSHKEWTGRWSDNSVEWYSIDESMRHKLRQIKDNGSFWMPWLEFWRIFTDITICSFSPDFDSDGLSDGLDNVFCVYGSWTTGNSGGAKKIPANPTYELSIPDNGVAPYLIVAECFKKYPSHDTKSTAGNIVVCEVEPSTESYKYIGTETMSYSTINPITRRFELVPGRVYHLMVVRYQPRETGDYMLRIFSRSPIKVRPADPQRSVT